LKMVNSGMLERFFSGVIYIFVGIRPSKPRLAIYIAVAALDSERSEGGTWARN
jgi:hypothetical protein